MKRAFSLMALLLCLCAHAMAATYYVSPKGSDSADGSSATPLRTPAYAMTRMASGDTLIFRDGEYAGCLVIPVSLSGTEIAPTIFRAENKWKAMLYGSLQQAVYSDATYVTLDGFEVTGAHLDGVKMRGNGTCVRNNWIHNNGTQGIGGAGNGANYESNCVEYNGHNPQYHHGFYVSGDRVTIRNNIVRRNSGDGIQLQPSITNSYLYNNLIHDNGRAPLTLYIAAPCGKNYILNNTICGSSGLGMVGSNGDVVQNNLIFGGFPSVSVSGGSGIVADYNFTYPKYSGDGSHGITGSDPGFINAVKGNYWLKTTSVCIGKGVSIGSMPTDFWGRPMPAVPQMGAFPYSQYLTTPEATATWPGGWAYRAYLSDPFAMLPDFWAVPTN